jgi:hypothetical protein
METVLIVLLVLFVFGGGGWGYSRWRGWSDHRMNAARRFLPLICGIYKGFDSGDTPRTLFQIP